MFKTTKESSGRHGASEVANDAYEAKKLGRRVINNADESASGPNHQRHLVSIYKCSAFNEPLKRKLSTIIPITFHSAFLRSNHRFQLSF
jgi:hypothetical protein